MHLLVTVSALKGKGKTMHYQDRLHRVLTYVFENPGEDLSLDRLADIAAMSRFHWHRVFHAMTGETCAQMVRRVRLHAAAGRLVRESTAVDKIARDCGYPNPRSFAQAFRQSYGMTPAAFRKSGKFAAPALHLAKGKTKMFPVDIRPMEDRKLIGLPHEGAYMQIGQSFEKTWIIIAQNNLFAQMGAAMAVYYHNPDVTPEAELRSFAGAEWRGEAVPEGLEARKLAGGKTAVLTYKGPYAMIKSGYDQLFGEWLPQSGEEPADAPCYEIYLNDPRSTAPEDLLTEICLPLK
jgi:AraC family transcriptional regulator